MGDDAIMLENRNAPKENTRGTRLGSEGRFHADDLLPASWIGLPRRDSEHSKSMFKMSGKV